MLRAVSQLDYPMVGAGGVYESFVRTVTDFHLKVCPSQPRKYHECSQRKLLSCLI